MINNEEELKEKIEEYKRRTGRTHVLDADIEMLIRSCGGSVDLAIALIRR